MNLLKSFIWKAVFIVMLIYGVHFEVQWAGNLLIAWIIVVAISIPVAFTDSEVVNRVYSLPRWRKLANNTVNLWGTLMLVAYGWWVTAILLCLTSLSIAAMQNMEGEDDSRG